MENVRLQNSLNIRLAGLGFIVLALLSFVARTRFHVGVEFSSWEIVANASVFFFLLLYGLIVFELIPLRDIIRSRMQWGLFSGIIFFTIIAPLFGNTFGLQGVQKIGYHDGTAQTNYAFEELLKGNNPYSVDYAETGFVDTYGRVVYSNEGDTIPNPALTQYIYLPATLIQGGIGYLQKLLIGTDDQRPMILVVFFASLGMLLYMFRTTSTNEKILFSSLFLLNPIYLGYVLEGGNNTFVIFLLIAAFLSLLKKGYIFSALFFGLAFATKHFALFFLPFLIVYLFEEYKNLHIQKKTLQYFYSVISVVVLIFIIPFFLWSPSDFIQDTVLYASGTGNAIIFPITGYGFSQLVTLFGVDIQSQFPFIIFTGVATLIVGYLGIRYVRRTPTFFSLIVAGSFTMFVYVFFSRMMNDNYVGFIFELLCVAYVFLYAKERVVADQHE